MILIIDNRQTGNTAVAAAHMHLTHSLTYLLAYLPSTQVWLSPAAHAMEPGALPPFTMVGFVSGGRAERIGKLPDAEVARLMLAQVLLHLRYITAPNYTI